VSNLYDGIESEPLCFVSFIIIASKKAPHCSGCVSFHQAHLSSIIKNIYEITLYLTRRRAALMQREEAHTALVIIIIIIIKFPVCLLELLMASLK
jgi:hypothetical protein